MHKTQLRDFRWVCVNLSWSSQKGRQEKRVRKNIYSVFRAIIPFSQNSESRPVIKILKYWKKVFEINPHLKRKRITKITFNFTP
jgi:hypothetical protein